MQVRAVIKWMIAISLIATIVVGGGGAYLWAEKDELLHQQLLTEFHKAAPELRLTIERTQVEGTSSVTLHDIEIHDRQRNTPLFRADEVSVDIDSEAMLKRQQLIIDKVNIKSAEAIVVRRADGSWNWQDYKFSAPEAKTKPALPLITLQHSRIKLTLEHDHDLPPTPMLLDSPLFQAVPSSRESYDFDGGIQLADIGALKVTGGANMADASWNVLGKLENVAIDQQLFRLAESIVPGLPEQLQSAWQNALPNSAAIRTAATDSARIPGANLDARPNLNGRLNVNFEVGSSPERRVPDFRVLCGLRDGSFSAPQLPYPAEKINLDVYKDNQHIVVRLNGAAIGEASVTGKFKAVSGSDVPPMATFNVQRFPVSMKLMPLLPAATQRLFNMYQPDGHVTLTGRVERHADGRWLPYDCKLDVLDGTVEFYKFRYPLNQISGQVIQRPFAAADATKTTSATSIDDLMFDLNITGSLGGRPVKIGGWLKNPGPVAENRITASLEGLPLDGRFRNALLPEQQKVLEKLDLKGNVAVDGVFYRAPGFGQPTHPFFDIRLSDGTMKFQNFPYAIDQLTGHVKFNGATKTWDFLKLNGSHGDSRLSAAGRFVGTQRPGILNLAIATQGTKLDSDLYNALGARQQQFWLLLEPQGRADITTQIDWVAAPGNPPTIVFPKETPVRIYNGRIRPKAFPYRMDVEEAIISFNPNDPQYPGVQHCLIHSFKASHGNSPITANGWADIRPDGEWQLHLNDVDALRLKPDNQLRAALPVSWKEAVQRLKDVGHVSVHKSEIDFRGTTDGLKIPTARWKMNLSLDDAAVTAGLDVSDMYGRVIAEGQWDGVNLTSSGRINLETAELLEMPFNNIEGPFTLTNTELVLGSRQVFENGQTAQIDRANRVTGRAYGGQFALDAMVETQQQGRYRFFTELNDARLESYAQLHIQDQRNLRGVVNAWMSLEGSGEDARNVRGKGQLKINPAALYELPVVVKLLSSLSQGNPNVQNLTAFDWAMVNFDVYDQAFWLRPVDLVGESISFRGQGSVGFSGAVNLDFYSRPPRSSLATLPFINGLLTNWAKVEVRGTTSQPQTMVKSAAKLDAGLKQFLQPFAPNPNGPAPILNVPRVFPIFAPFQQGPFQPGSFQQSPGLRQGLRSINR